MGHLWQGSAWVGIADYGVACPFLAGLSAGEKRQGGSLANNASAHESALECLVSQFLVLIKGFPDIRVVGF